MSDDKEREDLDALTKAPGWLRYQNEMRRQWEGRFDEYVSAAVLNRNADALTELLKLSAARTAVMAAIRYPEERIRQLDEMARQRTLDMHQPLSRRGTL